MKILHNFNNCFKTFRSQPYSTNQSEERGRIVYKHDPKNKTAPQDDFSALFQDISPKPDSIIMGRPFLCPVGENYDRLCFNESSLRYDEFSDKIFMMTSGYMPLNHMVQHQSEAVIIFDINPIQLIFWELTLEYIEHHETSVNFFKSLQENGQQDYEQRVTEWLGKECPEWLKNFAYNDGINSSVETLFKDSYNTSWKKNNTIAKQENYHYLRQLVIHGAVAIIALDAYDVDALNIISATLKNNHFTKLELKDEVVIEKSKRDGVSVSAQYLSNIFENRLKFNMFSNKPSLFTNTNGLTQLWDQRNKTSYEIISAGHAWNNIVGEQGAYRISGMEPALRYIDPKLF